MTPEKSPATSPQPVCADVVEALVNLNSDASIARVQRTRRALRVAAFEIEERRLRQRRTLGVVLLAFLSMLVLLGPTIWNGVEELLAGEPFVDLSSQVTILLLILAPAMLAALVAGWKGHRIQHRRSV